jgi:hypothetical protein
MQIALLGPDFPMPLDRPFTFAQARAAGISRRTLEGLLSELLVRRMLKGVYVAAQAPDTQLLRAQAIRLVVPEGCIVTDESAGWLAGADMILPPNAHLEVPPLRVYATGGHHRLRNDICVSGTRDLLRRDITMVHGVATTTPLRTALDLGRLRYRDQSLAALDQLLGLDVFTKGELLDEIPRFKGARGVRQLRLLAPIADGLSESPGESALRLRFYDGGLPIPEPQRDIFNAAGRFLGRSDLLVEELRFIAEYDGERWHGPDEEEDDARRRDGFERAGYTVRVLRKQNVFGQHQDVIEILQLGIIEARRKLGLGSSA